MWSDRTVRLLLVVGLLFASDLVLVLVRQNRAHRAAYAELYRRTSRPSIGAYVPTFQATALDGRSVVIGDPAPGQRQVIFVFTTTCRFCYASLAAWRSIAAQMDSLAESRVSVIGLSLDSAEITRSYVATNRLTFPVVRFPNRRLVALYRAYSVPQSYVLDESGRILYAHSGALQDRAVIDSMLAVAFSRQASARERSAAPLER